MHVERKLAQRRLSPTSDPPRAPRAAPRRHADSPTPPGTREDRIGSSRWRLRTTVRSLRANGGRHAETSNDPGRRTNGRARTHRTTFRTRSFARWRTYESPATVKRSRPKSETHEDNTPRALGLGSGILAPLTLRFGMLLLWARWCMSGD